MRSGALMTAVFARRSAVLHSQKANGPGSFPPGPRKTCCKALFCGGVSVGAWTLDQLDISHRRRITDAHTALEDTQVATLALAVTRTELEEQLAHGDLVTQTREREAAIGDAIDLGQRDQRLGDAAQFLGLGQRGADELMLEQRRGHVLEHRFAMAAGAIELTSGFLVAHK